jgi:hypothetical protein
MVGVARKVSLKTLRLICHNVSMAKKKAPMLQGIDWSQYKGEHPLGIAPSHLNKVKVGPPKEPEAPDTHIYGYHSSFAEPEDVLSKGLKASNPLEGSGLEVTDEQNEAATGVYFHNNPHIEYGSNLYRIKVSRDEPISGEFDRPGEGSNTLGDVPAKNVKYVGHGTAYNLSDFHATSLPSEKCPACIIQGIHYQEMAKRNASTQFTD